MEAASENARAEPPYRADIWLIGFRLFRLQRGNYARSAFAIERVCRVAEGVGRFSARPVIEAVAWA
jgi:hypothetical protein